MGKTTTPVSISISAFEVLNTLSQQRKIYSHKYTRNGYFSTSQFLLLTLSTCKDTMVPLNTFSIVVMCVEAYLFTNTCSGIAYEVLLTSILGIISNGLSARFKYVFDILFLHLTYNA